MSQERVSVEIRLSDIAYTLITSQGQVDEFLVAWECADGGKLLEISGVSDHWDANNVRYVLEKDAITGVMVQEIKL